MGYGLARIGIVIVAVEKRGRATGGVRMAVVPDFKSTALTVFLKENVAAGSRYIPTATALGTDRN